MMMSIILDGLNGIIQYITNMETPFRVLCNGHTPPIQPMSQTRRNNTVHTLYSQHNIDVPSHAVTQISLSVIYESDPYDEEGITSFLCATPESLIAEYGCHCITRVVYADEVITVWIINNTNDNVHILRGTPVCDLLEY